MKKSILIIFLLVFYTGVSQVNLQWARQLGGFGIGESANCVKVDKLGNVYTIGGFDSIVDFDPGPTTFTISPWAGGMIFISKLDASGNFVWAKNFGGMGAGRVSIALDTSGNVYATGEFTGTADFNPNIGTFTLNSGPSPSTFISKLDPSGNLIWAKGFRSSNQFTQNYANCISLDASGNVYIAGLFSDTVDVDPGVSNFTLAASSNSGDAFISKFDAVGNFIWIKQITGASFTTKREASSIKIDYSGDICILGGFIGIADFDPGPGVYNLSGSGTFILKLTASGNFIWAEQIQNAGGSSISIDLLNNIYVTGGFTGTVDFNPGPGTFTISTTNNDTYIVRLNSVGNFIWAKQIATGCFSAGTSVVDISGNIYTAGFFCGTNDFDPGPTSANLVCFGQYDVFISKLDSSGNFIWALQQGGNLWDYCYSIAIDAVNNIYTTGRFQGACDFDPGAGVYNLNSNGGTFDVFVSKIIQSSLGVASFSNINNELIIYPNPANGILNIEIDNNINHSIVVLYNSIGEKVYEGAAGKGLNTINTFNLKSGLYNVLLLDNNKRISSCKLIIE